MLYPDPLIMNKKRTGKEKVYIQQIVFFLIFIKLKYHRCIIILVKDFPVVSHRVAYYVESKKINNFKKRGVIV